MDNIVTMKPIGHHPHCECPECLDARKTRAQLRPSLATRKALVVKMTGGEDASRDTIELIVNGKVLYLWVNDGPHGERLIVCPEYVSMTMMLQPLQNMVAVTV